MSLEIPFDVAPAEFAAGEEELQDDAAVVKADVVALFFEGGRVFFAAEAAVVAVGFPDGLEEGPAARQEIGGRFL